MDLGTPANTKNQIIAPEIFKAYDIRGIVDQTLNVESVYAIGRAIGSEAHARGQKRIVVGRDGRLSGSDFTDALIRGLMATGRDIINIGMVPTPVVYFASYYLETGSAVMVTGSHNPPEYNGFKIVLADETLSGEAIQFLRIRIETENFHIGSGSRSETDISHHYIKRISSDINLKRPLKIVVDAGNGVAGKIAQQLYRDLGCEVEALHCTIDGNFPNHHPNPSQPETLSDLIDAVKTGHADLGLAFDGDGDRLGVVTATGEIIWPDRLLMLFAKEILSRHPGSTVMYDIKCSHHLKKLIEDAGGKPLMCRTGHSMIKAQLKKVRAPIAGEMSGHIFFKDRWYGFDDGLYAGARLLEILSSVDQSANEIFATLPNAICTPEFQIPMPEGMPHRYMTRLLKVADFGDAELITLDGLRVNFSDGWGLVRASNTTSSLTLRFEAETEHALTRIQNQFRTLMLSLDSRLSLPF